MAKQKDILWKVAIEQLFNDFLFFINPDVAQSLDLTKEFQFLNKELNQDFPSENGKHEQKIVDKLVRLTIRGIKKEQILLHLEIQEKYSKNFSERMYRYFNKLYAKYNIPIVAYAIFTETNKIERTDTFDINYSGTRITYQFNTFKIAAQDDDFLIDHPSPFALIILIAKASRLRKGSKGNVGYDDRLLDYKLKMFKLILERKLPIKKEMAIMNFLFYYIDFEFKETNAKFDDEVNSLTNKTIKDMITYEEVLLEDAETTGFLKAKQEAKENEVYRRIVKEGLSDQQIALYAEVPLKFVRKIRAGIIAKTDKKQLFPK